MNRIEVFLIPVLAITLILLFTQSISLRVQYTDKLSFTVEYFPFRLILYDFKNRKKKIKLKRQLKRFSFFLVPISKSTRFLLRHSTTEFFSLQFNVITSSEPHRLFLYNELKRLGSDYIKTTLFSLSKRFYTRIDRCDPPIPLDIEFSTRLYNIPLALFILLFFSIKNIGRNKKIV